MSYLSETRSLELFIMQQRALREAAQMKSVLNAIPEAVMIVQDKNLYKERVAVEMSMHEGTINTKAAPDYRLQFCNQATASLAGERLDTYSKQILETTKLLSKRIFSKTEKMDKSQPSISIPGVTPPKLDGSFIFRTQLISLEYIMQELLAIKQESVRKHMSEGTVMHSEISQFYMLHLGRRETKKSVRVRLLEIHIDTQEGYLILLEFCESSETKKIPQIGKSKAPKE